MQDDAAAATVEPPLAQGGVGMGDEGDSPPDELADLRLDNPVEALKPAIVVKFLSRYESPIDGGEKFIRALRGHPIINDVVLARNPHSRSEYIMLSKLFLHWCTARNLKPAEAIAEVRESLAHGMMWPDHHAGEGRGPSTRPPTSSSGSLPPLIHCPLPTPLRSCRTC